MFLYNLSVRPLKCSKSSKTLSEVLLTCNLPRRASILCFLSEDEGLASLKIWVTSEAHRRAKGIASDRFSVFRLWVISWACKKSRKCEGTRIPSPDEVCKPVRNVSYPPVLFDSLVQASKVVVCAKRKRRGYKPRRATNGFGAHDQKQVRGGLPAWGYDRKTEHPSRRLVKVYRVSGTVRPCNRHSQRRQRLKTLEEV